MLIITLNNPCRMTLVNSSVIITCAIHKHILHWIYYAQYELTCCMYVKNALVRPPFPGTDK